MRNGLLQCFGTSISKPCSPKIHGLPSSINPPCVALETRCKAQQCPRCQAHNCRGCGRTGKPYNLEKKCIKIVALFVENRPSCTEVSPHHGGPGKLAQITQIHCMRFDFVGRFSRSGATDDFKILRIKIAALFAKNPSSFLVAASSLGPLEIWPKNKAFFFSRPPPISGDTWQT